MVDHAYSVSQTVSDPRTPNRLRRVSVTPASGWGERVENDTQSTKCVNGVYNAILSEVMLYSTVTSWKLIVIFLVIGAVTAVPPAYTAENSQPTPFAPASRRAELPL